MNTNKAAQVKITGLLAGIVLCTAIFAHGYTNPTVSAPGDNSEQEPISIDGSYGIKSGGLSVGTFQARDNAWLAQDVFFGGMLRGGVASDTSSTIEFGNGSERIVSVDQTGSLQVDGAIQSPQLQSSGSELVCADASGTLIICP